MTSLTVMPVVGILLVAGLPHRMSGHRSWYGPAGQSGGAPGADNGKGIGAADSDWAE